MFTLDFEIEYDYTKGSKPILTADPYYSSPGEEANVENLEITLEGEDITDRFIKAFPKIFDQIEQRAYDEADENALAKAENLSL